MIQYKEKRRKGKKQPITWKDTILSAIHYIPVYLLLAHHYFIPYLIMAASGSFLMFLWTMHYSYYQLPFTSFLDFGINILLYQCSKHRPAEDEIQFSYFVRFHSIQSCLTLVLAGMISTFFDLLNLLNIFDQTLISLISQAIIFYMFNPIVLFCFIKALQGRFTYIYFLSDNAVHHVGELRHIYENLDKYGQEIKDDN